MDGQKNNENLHDDDGERRHGWERFRPMKNLPIGIEKKLGSTAKELNDYRRGNELYLEEEEAHEEYIAMQKQRQPINIEEVRDKYPSYYHDWQIECLERIKDERNVILSSPTGSGKTTVFLDWAERKREEAEKNGQAHHTVYITSPIKALSNQRYRELKKAGYKVGLETGDVKIVPGDVDYICCTQEIYTNKYIDDENATLIVDEFHYIFENSDRARTYIDGLYNSGAKNTLICSATFGDMSETVRYVEKVTGKDQYGYENHDRLTKLVYEGRLYDKNDIKNALVVAFSVRNCEDIAHDLYRARIANGVQTDIEDDYLERTHAIEELAKSSNIDNEELLQRAKHGISTYYGRMLPKEKAFVEKLFSERLVDTVVGTDALALGVNFPVEMVVFCQLAKYKDGPISKNLFDQLSGRAGRPGFFDKGEIYFCDDFYHKDYRGNEYPIEAKEYDTEQLYEGLKNAKNEKISIKLEPNFKDVLKGKRTIEEEVEYLETYSMSPIDEYDIASEYEYLTNLVPDDIFAEIVKSFCESNADAQGNPVVKALLQWYSGFSFEYDWRSRTVTYGHGYRNERDDEYKFSPIGSTSFYDNEDYIEAEERVLDRYNISSLEELNSVLIEVLADCYDSRFDSYFNKRYANLVFFKEKRGFEEEIKHFSRNLPKLMNLRSYLRNIPKKYRNDDVVDSLYKIEQMIDEIDETVLGEGAGRIQLSEVSELLQSRVNLNNGLDVIEDKINGVNEEQLSKNEVESLFSLQFGDSETWKGEESRIEELRRHIKLKDIIDSGIEVEWLLEQIKNLEIRHPFGYYQAKEEAEYCLNYLIENNLLKKMLEVRKNYFGLVPSEVVLGNFQTIVDNGGTKNDILECKLRFTEPSQVELFADIPFETLIASEGATYGGGLNGFFGTIEVLKKVSEQHGVSFDELAKLELIPKKVAKDSLDAIIKTFGVSPNSLIKYFHDGYDDDGEYLTKLVEYGANDRSLAYLSAKWVLENYDKLRANGVELDDKIVYEEEMEQERLSDYDE